MMKISLDATKYLGLLRKAITASLYEESAWRISKPKALWKSMLVHQLAKRNLQIVERMPFDAETRLNGEDWPMFGFSMAGEKRLQNVEACIASVIGAEIPGDFVECGVWRGGSSIYARAALDVYGGADRTVWLADSFAGMPARTGKDMADPELKGTTYLEVSLESVMENFRRFELLSDRVKFIKGWFSESLPKSSIERISILRLDGDYYSSTMDALNALYDKVSLGGFVIIDDYNAFVSCKEAVTDFCTARNMSPKLISIDDNAVYWRK